MTWIKLHQLLDSGFNFWSFWCKALLVRYWQCSMAVLFSVLCLLILWWKCFFFFFFFFCREGLVYLRVCFSPFIQSDLRYQQTWLSETRKQVGCLLSFFLAFMRYFAFCVASVGLQIIVCNWNCVWRTHQFSDSVISVCRAFYLALYKHMMFLEKRGCPRTALEFCKLILRYRMRGLSTRKDKL